MSSALRPNGRHNSRMLHDEQWVFRSRREMTGELATGAGCRGGRLVGGLLIVETRAFAGNGMGLDRTEDVGRARTAANPRDGSLNRAAWIQRPGRRAPTGLRIVSRLRGASPGVAN